MYHFTRSDWTIEDTDRKRLGRISKQVATRKPRSFTGSLRGKSPATANVGQYRKSADSEQH